MPARRLKLELVNVILAMLYMANIETDECVRLEREICALANEVIPNILSALPPSSPVADSPTWQPMESAPTDHEGPSILTWSANGGVHLTTRGFTAALRRASWFDEKGWSIHPTHWMPLPSAPSPSAGAAKETKK